MPLVEVMISVALVAVASMAIGLLVSSAVSTSERAMPLVFLLVMVQVITTGGIFPVHGKPGIEQLAWVTPARNRDWRTPSSAWAAGPGGGAVWLILKRRGVV